MKFLLIAALLALSGCSSQEETADGITEFMKSCDAPVRGTLALSNFNNSLTLQCDRLKPGIKGRVAPVGDSK